MQKQQTNRQQPAGPGWVMGTITAVPGPMMVGIILLVALLAFELFNFDTTRFALANLLGDVRFAGVQWATILAIAFCSIDFAGLVRFFMPGTGSGRQTEYWYLTGAWLLGATMNAIMTWWAVSLTLLNHDLGNEVLSRAQLLEVVPIFVAALVWLTRILFIGAFTVAGGYLFAGQRQQSQSGIRPSAALQTRSVQPQRRPVAVRQRPARRPAVMVQPPLPQSEELPGFLVVEAEQVEPETAVVEAVPPPPQPATPAADRRSRSSRIRRRPPAPAPSRGMPAPMHASGRRR